MVTIITTLMLLTGTEVPDATETSLLQTQQEESLLSTFEEEILLYAFEEESLFYEFKKENVLLEESVEVREQPKIEEPEQRASLTVEEKDLLERLVTAEARNEELEGKVAVAEVVLNRMDSEQFPDELEEVVYQKDQFSPVSNGSINNAPTEKSKKAVQEALKGTDETNGALFFYNDNIIKKSWLESRQTTTRIGQHVFKR